jgi:hypothetical protein
MRRLLVLVLVLAGCETDDFFITDGDAACSSESGEPTTSSVMPEPLTEITTGLDTTDPKPPSDPGRAPAQERP